MSASDRGDALRVGIIGYGYWGPNLARNFMETDGWELGAVCDQRPERLEIVSRRFPAARMTTDVDSLFADARLDALAIATPVASHFELARRALEAGKHVLVEKPLSLSSAQADELIDLADRRRLVLMVDHTFVYTGAVRKVKELVSSGDLGTIYYFDSVRINLGLFQHDVNVLWDLAVHDLSILDYVLQRAIVGVSAIGAGHLRGQQENTAYLTLLLEGDVLAHLHANWLSPLKIRRTVIGGSRKMVVYDDVEPSEKVKVYDSGAEVVRSESDVHRMLVSYRVGDMHAPKLDLTEALHTAVAHFLECIRKGEKPLTDGKAGRRVVRILEAAALSMRERGRMVELGD